MLQEAQRRPLQPSGAVDQQGDALTGLCRDGKAAIAQFEHGIVLAGEVPMIGHLGHQAGQAQPGGCRFHAQDPALALEQRGGAVEQCAAGRIVGHDHILSAPNAVQHLRGSVRARRH